MKKLIKLDIDSSISINNNLINFLNPDLTYIPVYSGYKIIVKQSEKINKEQIILESDNNIPIYSPISGEIAGGINRINYENKTIPCIAIRNNYKEELKKKISSSKNYKNFKKEDFIDKLYNLGTLNSENSNYLLSDIFKENNSFKYIIIKGFDDEPYIENTHFELLNFKDEILNTIDALNNIFDTTSYIVIKNKYNDIIIDYNESIGTYPKINIKLVNDMYPLNNNKILKEMVFNDRNDSKDILVLSLQNIININNAIKRNRQTTEKYITISGNAVVNPSILNVKIGTSLKEIISNNIELKENDVIYMANGLMKGYEISKIDNLIVTNDFIGLIINKKEKIVSTKCINCGLCYRVCPVNINPRNIDKTKCINCGLCSYYCPAKIDLLNKRGDNNE